MNKLLKNKTNTNNIMIVIPSSSLHFKLVSKLGYNLWKSVKNNGFPELSQKSYLKENIWLELIKDEILWEIVHKLDQRNHLTLNPHFLHRKLATILKSNFKMTNQDSEGNINKLKDLLPVDQNKKLKN